MDTAMTTAPRRTLFAIGDDLLALEDLLTELGGDVSGEEAEAAIDAWLAEIEGDLEAKLDGYAALIKEATARAQARRDAARSITDLARADESLASRLKDRLLYFFRVHGKKRIDTPRARITRCANGGRQPLAVDEDVDALPERFQRVTVTFSFCPADLSSEMDAHLYALLEESALSPTNNAYPDEAKIREALEAGEDLPFARYAERGEHIRIQ